MGCGLFLRAIDRRGVASNAFVAVLLVWTVVKGPHWLRLWVLTAVGALAAVLALVLLGAALGLST